jgi:hypothetical protein
MRNFYDVQHDAAETILNLPDDIIRHGDVASLDAFQQVVPEARHLFPNIPDAYPILKEYSEHALRADPKTLDSLTRS